MWLLTYSKELLQIPILNINIDKSIINNMGEHSKLVSVYKRTSQTFSYRWSRTSADI